MKDRAHNYIQQQFLPLFRFPYRIEHHQKERDTADLLRSMSTILLVRVAYSMQFYIGKQ